MKKAIGTACAVTLVMLGFGFSLAIASGKTGTSAAGYGTRGGEIDISAKTPGKVQLASNRFTCASCAIRVTPKIKALPGVSKVAFSPFVASSQNGSAKNGLIGTLTITFDPFKTTALQIATVAQRALESDPYNRNPVKIVQRKSP